MYKLGRAYYNVICIGTSGTEFKTRFRNHEKALNHRRYEKDTDLSKYVWSLRDKRQELYNKIVGGP